MADDITYLSERETLRLNESPTAPAVTKQLVKAVDGIKANLCRGKYQLELTDKILALPGIMQQDPLAYGADANEFRPERMMQDNFKNLPDTP
ncbi:hypothetical protein EYC84_007168 [Monilinia fructicola]|uniref:Uncharacterized protein n=1 Tax=Monilinia fructicola TaxID=38448 RepID=A0A5M9KAP8_MONFR|nr:hypothetical protein EYC84_007168 [Monilinia fructicola]